jgi:hypothetical protein
MSPSACSSRAGFFRNRRKWPLFGKSGAKIFAPLGLWRMPIPCRVKMAHRLKSIFDISVIGGTY